MTDPSAIREGGPLRIAFVIAAAALIIGGTVLVFEGSLTGTGFAITDIDPDVGRVYQVTFEQQGACAPPPLYTAPWSVILAAETEAEPSNATLSIPSSPITAGPTLVNSSIIVFSVPDGVYQYTISPEFGFSPSSGTVRVQGDDVTIMLYEEISCSLGAGSVTD
jgi:hypothetical protein